MAACSSASTPVTQAAPSTVALPTSGAVRLKAEVWADNWFAFYLGDTKVAEDSVPITTERSFNAETFVFDALHQAEGPIVMRTDRVEEFAPIKNASGEDSPATSKALQVERAVRWLKDAGVPVPCHANGQPGEPHGGHGRGVCGSGFRRHGTGRGLL